MGLFPNFHLFSQVECVHRPFTLLRVLNSVSDSNTYVTMTEKLHPLPFPMVSASVTLGEEENLNFDLNVGFLPGYTYREENEGNHMDAQTRSFDKEVQHPQ